MKSFRRHSATVNAGSMADIAFLLLIFFLVTTTISADKGILRKLPGECPPNTNCTDKVAERNLLRIAINSNQEIMIENDIVPIDEIQSKVIAFADNNGKSNCDYCDGEQSANLSDHPKDAVISLSHDALTKYQLFVSVQDEITKAYYDLRARYAKQKFNKTPDQLTEAELDIVKKAYPFVVSEIMVKRTN
ncbi:biopolymer transporter ExbD [Winogradskyella echinorum]|uniref:Biopolymer transporter ExbD n=1 Tax=Winogradskyella echinorum TaxID=538189 RepID=A0ABR6Y0V7_9FLAO|nr:biopolymer transporter ExbD [Winogradskyella echinorum]MBC3846384.1 biopolymer transporter ExbD [Winogradskyella echinorum]MBC5750732.1 biopolymer transporter ExbD [Winogradskyella echinorum]